MKKAMVVFGIIVLMICVSANAVIVEVTGTITSTELDGYVNVGDRYKVTAVINDYAIDELDLSNEDMQYQRGDFDAVVAWNFELLEGSTGSFVGHSESLISGTDVTTFDHNADAEKWDDQFGFSGGNRFHSLAENAVYLIAIRLWDETATSLNDAGSGQTLLDVTNNYQLLRNWTPHSGGDFTFDTSVDLRANGTVDSVTIVPEPATFVLRALGGLLTIKSRNQLQT